MDLNIYPVRCRRNIKKLSGMLCTDYETVYAMMLMTATLMDLKPEDEQVADMILEDCGISTECA